MLNAHPILAVGTMAFDSIETPFAKGEKILGGSLNYFSLSASFFTKILGVSVIGDDFPEAHLKELQSRGIDTSGIQRDSGETFFWKGRYGYNLNEAETLDTRLNVFENFSPTIPNHYKDSEIIFLGNIPPALQLDVLKEMKKAKFVALDTMNYWIHSSPEALFKVIEQCNAMILNEGEARQLSKEHSLVKAGRFIQNSGPKIVVIKRGEYGAVLFFKERIFSLPGLPLAEAKDPTGAGDSFAGGFLGFLASQAKIDWGIEHLRKAVVYGSVMASFVVEDLGIARLLSLDTKAIDSRYHDFVELTSFHG